MDSDKKEMGSGTEIQLNASGKSDIYGAMTDEEKINEVAARILELYRPAFEELAK